MSNAPNFPTGTFTVPYVGGMPALWGGNIYYADPGNITGRAAAGNPGTIEYPFSTVVGAYNACTAEQNDTVVFLGDGTTTASERLASTFTWSKSATHLIGVTAPTRVAQRCRFTGPSTGGTFSPLMTVSGNGCIFVNFSMFDDYTVDPVCLKVTGQRNYFGNVHIGGMGAATGADDAAGASLWLSGGAENTFENCVIGLDTIPRSTTNGEILMDTAAKRNFFENCDIVSYSDSNGHLFVKAANSGDLDRWTVFNNCRFHNAPTGIASGTTMLQAMNVHASAGGYIWVTGDSSAVGCTDWAAADNGNVFVDRVVAAAGTAGLAVAVTR